MKPSLWAEIHRLAEIEKLSKRAIGRRLDCCPKTVAKALSIAEPPSPRRIDKGRSKLDDYTAAIDRLVRDYPDLSAVRILEEIQPLGYDGGVGLLRRYLQKTRPKPGRMYREIDWLPGDAFQVDWGDCDSVMIDGVRRRVSVFVAVLCYSRMLYIEFTLDQKKETFYRCIRRALEYWGGAPARIIVDNLKAAVLAGHGREARWHPEFLSLCGHYRLEPVACQRRDPESKGMVEAAVRYVKANALSGRELTCFSAYSRLAPEWLASVANLRRHSTTGVSAVALLPKETLRALPARPADTDVVTSTSSNAYARVLFETNHYSVPPAYAGKAVTLRADDVTVTICHEERVIATHRRCYGRKATILDPDHEKEIRARTAKASLGLVEARFDNLCAGARAYRHGLIQAPIKATVHMRRILRLAQLYGTTDVAQALEAALAYKAFDAAYICNLVEQNRRKEDLPSPMPLAPIRKELLALEDLEAPCFETYDRLIEGVDDAW